jgi:hypothetical protein
LIPRRLCTNKLPHTIVRGVLGAERGAERSAGIIKFETVEGNLNFKNDLPR